MRTLILKRARMLKLGIRALLIISLLFLSFGCNPEAKKVGPLGFNIVTTTGLIGDLATEIAGPEFKVISLMGPGVDPHLYKATQGDLERLQSADVIFFNGLHLEGKMAELLERFSTKKPCFPITRDIDRSKLRAPPEFEGSFDPHIWFDVSLWREASFLIEKELVERYPSQREGIHSRATQYRVRLDEIDGWTRSEIATIPKAQRILVTAHDAFGYFGRAYDIEVLGLQGISTASEFGLKDLAVLSETIISRKVKAVFVESSVPERFINALQEGIQARGHEVKKGGSLFSDALGGADTPEGKYLGMIHYNVETIVKALK